MFECGTYKPSIDVAFSFNVCRNYGFYLHIAFIFFYFQIDIDKDNVEVNEIRKQRLNKLKQ